MDIPTPATSRTPYVLLVLGVVSLLAGSYWGLFVAPKEAYMGDVQRIMYVHVPTAWNWMLAVLFATYSATAFLFTNNLKWDARNEAGLEVGTLLAILLCCQGAIWAKPTWGVWWDWDPRLTTTAVLLFAFLGILALRNFVEDTNRRAIWSAVATIIAAVDLPIVYMSVKWWNSLHQQQSTPQTVASAFHGPLRINAFGVLFLMIGFLMLRSRLATYRLNEELAVIPSEVEGPGGSGGAIVEPPARPGPSTKPALSAAEGLGMTAASGIVVGGWEFVWAAYGLTAAALLIYGVSLIVRLRQARNHAND